jgi:uncharacterized protein (TIGR03083 family)
VAEPERKQYTDCAPLILPLHEELLKLLRSLRTEDWNKPTVAKQWRVRDVAAHLLDGQLRVLALRRDKSDFRPDVPINSYPGLVAWLNRLNAEWVNAAKRLSPAVIVDMLALTGPQVAAYFASLDPTATATFSVAWAGEEQSTNQFDIAREYTEHWHHQQQIRDAVGAPLLLERKWFYPLAETCMRALPYSYRDLPASDGTAINFALGEAGGGWYLQRRAGNWELQSGTISTAAATVTTGPDTAWRIFFKALTREEAISRVQISGSHELGAPFCSTLAVMA